MTSAYAALLATTILTSAWVSEVAAQDAQSENVIGILLAAGDIAKCSTKPKNQGKQNETANLLQHEIAKASNIPVRVLSLGDLAYDHGQDFKCFNESWGAHQNIMLPVPGNHDYETNNGAPYYKTFKGKLTELNADSKEGFYSVKFPDETNGPWQLIGLNSNVGVGASSKQAKWLKTELEKASTIPCVLAFSHAFFYSSGRHGHGQNSHIDLSKPLVPEKTMRALFETLYDSRASVFVAGHDHHFEQLGRANAKGQATNTGVRSFVVGTGGAKLHGEESKGNDYQKKWDFQEAYDLKSYGILKLELRPRDYSWMFIPTKDNATTMVVKRDIKSDTCNRPTL